MLDAFEQVARQVHFKAPRIPFVSNLTGQILPAGEIPDASYWKRQLRESVQFSAGIQSLAQENYTSFLEIGPTSTLSAMGRDCLPKDTGNWLPSLEKGRDDWEVLLSSVATLYTQGVDLDWVGFDRDYTRRRVALPTYPFERERYWHETAAVDPHLNGRSRYQSLDLNGQQRHPLLEPPLRLAYPPDSYVWETILDKQRFPYLDDHRMKGKVLIPLSLYIEMVHAASLEIFKTRFSMLAKIELNKVLFLPENTSLTVQTVIHSQTSEAATFSIYSRSGEQAEAPLSWTLHASGKILYHNAL